ncbi:MAG: DegT/DnrJ/EryC1/StrS family aminotransferase [Ignavibacteria bacterium]|nr:DegT/DnrJ/EryC1/StrS family aminotransferase [Ignavibacteria bacterium]
MIPIAKPYLTNAEADEASRVVLSGWVAQGPKVKEFEEKFAEYTGARYAVAISNCTAALHLCMIVSGIGDGDEVICPSMSYIATANSIRYTGATPVFAEVDPVNFNLDPEDAESKITSRTKAIMIAHQIGMPADIDAFKEICARHNIKLIEDAACASGSSYKGKKIGSHSELVCFSFHPRKVITTGEGGMITTSNEKLRDRLKLLRQHAMASSSIDRHNTSSAFSEDHVELGYNYRMTDIQAAVGIVQLSRLDEIVMERRNIAAEFISNLSDIEWLMMPEENEGFFTNYQSFAVRVHNDSPVSRDELMLRLGEKGISTRRGVMTAHRETAYKDLYSKLSLPVSESASDNSLMLPIFVPMLKDDIGKIIERVRGIFRET